MATCSLDVLEHSLTGTSFSIPKKIEKTRVINTNSKHSKIVKVKPNQNFNTKSMSRRFSSSMIINSRLKRLKNTVATPFKLPLELRD